MNNILKALAFLLVGIFLTGFNTTKTFEWQYPIKIGDSRAKIERQVGLPKIQKDLFIYEHSGIYIKYDTSSRAVFLMFPATEFEGLELIITKNPIFSDLTIESSLDEYRSVLGEPDYFKHYENLTADAYKWKKDGLVIDCSFFNQDHMGFKKNQLMDLRVHPGI